MEIKITGTQKEITDFMLALTKSAEQAEQNDNTDTIANTESEFMDVTKSTVELPLTRTDMETVKQLTQNIHDYAKNLSSSEH